MWPCKRAPKSNDCLFPANFFCHLLKPFLNSTLISSCQQKMISLSLCIFTYKMMPLDYNVQFVRSLLHRCCTYTLTDKYLTPYHMMNVYRWLLKCLTAHTRPTRVCMAPSLSPASVAFSVKKKYTLSSSLSSLSGMRWAAMNLGSVEEGVGVLTYYSSVLNVQEQVDKKRNVTVQQFLVSLCPHHGATPHAPEDHRVSTQEICCQSCVQLPTYREEKCI